MKWIAALLMLSSLSTAAFAQLTLSDNPGCCRGLAEPPGNEFSKVRLDVPASCPPGSAVRAISFSHNKDENLTYQESFYLQCGPKDVRVSEQCDWSPPTSKPPIKNFDLTTSISAPADSVITGVEFQHDKDQNLTYQQSYRIQHCKLVFPYNTPAVDEVGTTTSKWYLQSHVSCDDAKASRGHGLAYYLGFSHPKGYNLTDNENVTLRCTLD